MDNISYESTLTSLGLGIGGGNRRWLKKMINELNISTSHWLGQGHLKNKNHNWNKKIPLSEVLLKNSDVNLSSYRRRIFAEGLLVEQCCWCGSLKTWNNKPLTLHIDHINGDHWDHRLENLRVLCPNCHSQTDTWCGKNVKRKPKSP